MNLPQRGKSKLQSFRSVETLRRCLIYVLLGALVGLAGGCVFIRLKTFQKQLAHFPEHCEYESENGPTIIFKKPLLRAGDITWLFDFKPSEVTEDEEGGTTYTYRVIKRYPGEGANDEGGVFDIVAYLKFEEGKLKRAEFPSGMEVMLNDNVIKHLFGGAAEGDVDKREKSTQWSIPDSNFLPSMDDLIKAAGEPYAREKKDDEVVLEYQFRIDGNGDKDDKHFYGKAAYDSTSKGFLWSEVHLGQVYFSMKLQKNGKYKVKLKRKLL